MVKQVVRDLHYSLIFLFETKLSQVSIRTVKQLTGFKSGLSQNFIALDVDGASGGILAIRNPNIWILGSSDQTSDPFQIAEEFRDFYGNLLGKAKKPLMTINWSDIYPPVYPLISHLDYPFFEDELLGVIKASKNYKSPRPDGILMEFFKKNGDLLKDGVLHILIDLQNNP
ncbi:hypothetical protein Cni_G25852 [Canna indica]|uniref:Uncharacterized protein n=1 Tax=Canna indica TaxID=4628 RepID=A0AAQ3L1W5_9LILI|nr:hypothetical protein Cni_G25852 [Canna indica]